MLSATDHERGGYLVDPILASQGGLHFADVESTFSEGLPALFLLGLR